MDIKPHSNVSAMKSSNGLLIRAMDTRNDISLGNSLVFKTSG